MDKHSLSRFSRVMLQIYSLAQSSDVHRFQDAVLQALSDILPFNSAMWGSATMTDAGIDIHTLHLHNTTTEMIEAYEKVKHLDHFAQEVVSRDRHTIRFSACDALSIEFQNFLQTYGHHHGLIAQCINPRTKFAQWLSLFRNNPAHPCSPKEVRLFSDLFPHLMQALAINRKLHVQHLLADASLQRWAVAISDQRGFLYYADTEFLRFLAKDHPHHDSESLPEGIVQALDRSERCITSQHFVIEVAPEQDLLFLKVRPRVLADDLNPREYLIAKLMSEGLSLRDIAEKLNRSPETIRTHGKAIYQKLGIKKVTQLSSLILQRE
jgi:DNA-binding CsgD family transcriptional regulator